MTEPTHATIEQEFHTLCSAGEYSAAYQLATREAGRFPESAQSTLYNWRFCTGCLVALPQSSQPMSAGHYGWNDRGWAVREITQHVTTVREQSPIDLERIVVAGFSMGGGLAAWLALSGTLAVRGFIGVGPFLAN